MKLAASSVVVALAAINCAVASDRMLLDQFFAASRLRDRTALARFATVVFEPRTDGIVQKFVVLKAAPERQVDEGRSSGQPAGLPDERQRVISLSLADPTDPLDLSALQTVLLEKTVTVSARIDPGDGTPVTRSIVLTLQRARLEHARGRLGRWIVVRFVY
jgi:hypothetical protein